MKCVAKSNFIKFYYIIFSLTDVGLSSLGVFVIDPISGSIVTSQTLEGDSSSAARYDLNVRVEDNGLPSRGVSRVLSVAVMDVNEKPPTFLRSNYEIIQEENEPVGSVVVTLGVTDDDATSTVTCKIVSGNVDSKFQISASNNVDIQNVIDLDAPISDLSYYSLVIEAVDDDLPQQTSSASVVVRILPVNEFSPVFHPDSLDPVFSVCFVTLCFQLFLWAHLV